MTVASAAAPAVRDVAAFRAGVAFPAAYESAATAVDADRPASVWARLTDMTAAAAAFRGARPAAPDAARRRRPALQRPPVHLDEQRPELRAARSSVRRHVTPRAAPETSAA